MQPGFAPAAAMASSRPGVSLKQSSFAAPFRAAQRRTLPASPMNPICTQSPPAASPSTASDTTAVDPATGWAVHKFGGTSLANAKRFNAVADIILAEKQAGGRVFAVVSAVGGITTRLEEMVDAAVTRRPDIHYQDILDEVSEVHEKLAKETLSEDAFMAFMITLKKNLSDLGDLLRATWIARSVSDRIQELIVGHGELWSAQILWSLLRCRDSVACSWMDARDVLVARSTEGTTNRKVVEFHQSGKFVKEWVRCNPTSVVVATGFVCQDKEGVASTLGRNGSDYSAACFANLLSASELNIWTDVDGVYSADPRVVSDAIVIPDMSYKEAAELAYFGAEVLHPDTMGPIMEREIPMRIRNTFNPSVHGTTVRATVEEKILKDDPKLEDIPMRTTRLVGRSEDARGVKGFTTVSNISIVNVEGTGMIGVPGIASRAFGALFNCDVSVILIAQASSEFSICIAVPGDQDKAAVSALKTAFRPELMDGLISSVATVPDCSILAMVGEQMQQQPGVSSRLFDSLTRAGVNIVAMAQGSSEHNISVVVDAQSESRALRAAHAAFYLSDQTISVGVIGAGVVGGALLSQISSQMEALREKFRVDLRVRGIATSRSMVFGEPIDLSDWEGALNGKGVQDLSLEKFAAYIQDTSLPHAVIFDCTASGVISDCYESWLRKGIHIITPNKKANSGPLDYYLAMRDAQKRLNSHFFYEANVGAGLPIITSIRDLLRTGDQFLVIEGIFSGTLSFIFNEFDGSEPFSAVVSRAKENGFTEPDPRDDLSGMDVARKVVILAREIGINIEMDDVPVKSLVPDELSGDDVSIEEFMKRLPDFDEGLTAMANEAKSAGELLRYVGFIDAENGKCSVDLKRYSKSHPFGRLSGSDNIVAFRTQRYNAQPLVVQGPGAGAEVTAAGVFGDLLRLAGYLGAPSAEAL